jgi:hypothetical protein
VVIQEQRNAILCFVHVLRDGFAIAPPNTSLRRISHCTALTTIGDYSVTGITTGGLPATGTTSGW